MQTHVTGLVNRTLDHQLTHQGEVSQFDDVSVGQGGSPHHGNLFAEQRQPALRSSQTSMRPDDAHFTRHRGQQASTIMQQGGVFNQQVQALSAPWRVHASIRSRGVSDEVFCHPSSIHHGLKKAV